MKDNKNVFAQMIKMGEDNKNLDKVYELLFNSRKLNDRVLNILKEKKETQNTNKI